MLRGLFLLGLTLVLATGCSQQDLLAQRQRKTAPRGSADVGVLLENAQAKDIQQILEDNPHAQVRILSRSHGIYEIFGVSQKDLQVGADVELSDNRYFQLASLPAPAGTEVPGLNTCTEGESYPEAVLTAVTDDQTLTSGEALEIGRSVKLDGSKSYAESGEPLKSVLLVLGPTGSKFEQEEYLQTDRLEFTPDGVGLFTTFLITQNSTDDACAVEMFQVVVTANPPFKGKHGHAPLNVKGLKHLEAVSAEESWKLSRGEDVVIAVIDSGVNYNHPSLAPNLILNEKEIADNGVDDDGNGIIDDVLGFDFVNSDGYPFDDDGHGSHVAGLAIGNETGLANRAGLLAVKAMSSTGGDFGTIAAAIRYAVDRGAKIINLSLGAATPFAHPAMVRAIGYAEEKGVLLVTAAGNGDAASGLGYDIDLITVFPASLENKNILTVTAADSENALAPYANYGRTSVDVVAPGGFMPDDPIYSAATMRGDGEMLNGLAGTSMAAPIVAGIAAQILSVRPSFTPDDLRRVLLAAGSRQSELKDLVVSGRHINALSALNLATEQIVSY